MQPAALGNFTCAVRAFCLVLLVAFAGCSNNHTITTVPPPNTNFIYTANAAGNPSTVSALDSDQTTAALTPIPGSPYGTGSGSRAACSGVWHGFPRH